MRPAKPAQKFVRYALGTLLALLALNAFGGGYYGMAGAKNVPLEWLNRSPFHNYFLPSLFLFAIVGGSALFAAIAVFRNSPTGYIAALACGVIVIAWLVVQVAIIGFVSWMQPATALASLLILFLAWLLNKQSNATKKE